MLWVREMEKKYKFKCYIHNVDYFYVQYCPTLESMFLSIGNMHTGIAHRCVLIAALHGCQKSALLLCPNAFWLNQLAPDPVTSPQALPLAFKLVSKLVCDFFPPVLFSPPGVFLSGLIVSSGNNYFSFKSLVPWGCFVQTTAGQRTW